MSGLLIHVGLHKCASTWLQQLVFSRREAGFCAPWGSMSHLAVTEFVAIDPLTFDAQAARRKFDAARARACGEGDVAVLSHEALSSRPHHGLYYSREVAARLKETFPEAKLLFLFREQTSMIHSLYGEHVRNGGRHTLAEFIGDGPVAEGFAPPCRLSFFEYDRLLAMYEAVFGADNVLALPLELLRNDPQDFLGRLTAFCGLPPVPVPEAERPNIGWGPVTVELYRRSNGVVRRNPLGGRSGPLYRLRQYVAWRLDRVVPASLNARLKRRQSDAISAFVGGHYRASNARLSDRLGLDLRELGYG